MKDNTFTIKLDKFYQGFSPTAHLSSLTQMGNSGSASVMTNCDIISDPNVLTQGPALTNLTNGTQTNPGVVTELIHFIMDKAVSDGVTYGIGATKLFKITPSTVTSDATWPRVVSNCLDGEGIIDLKGSLYYFYNRSGTIGEIGKYNLDATFTDAWGSTIPTGKAALQSALHPVAAKEDIMAFGNGRYMGTYVVATDTLAPTKLDFGNGYEVADVIFHANQWWIAVNSGTTGNNRNTGQIYLYDGAAINSVLSDETGIGYQRIGFLYVMNGMVYVCYQDLSSAGGYKIGYISGRQIKPLANFTGSLPTYAQKTLYKDTILFLSSGSVYSFGAVTDVLPLQISQIVDGGYATCGAMAAPFGVPMIASTDGSTNFRLAKFSGYDTSCTWKSIIIPTTSGRMKGYIDSITVLTNTLASGARADLTVEINQTETTSTVQQITTTGKRRHIFNNFGLVNLEDFRIALSWANGNATNNVAIREIQVNGHFLES